LPAKPGIKIASYNPEHIGNPAPGQGLKHHDIIMPGSEKHFVLKVKE
jgi:hypothetical protein